MSKTCIIGAGISGLSVAWQIQRLGGECMVLEQSPKVGGAMQSYSEGGYLAEEGPNSILLNNADVENFLLSVPDLSERIIEAETAANKRFIVRNGQPHAVPMGPLSAITTCLWSFAGKLRILKEPFIKAAPADAEESVADFVRRRLGDELYRYAINPLVGGIYAGDPEQLSLRYAFPKLHTLDQLHGGLIRGAIAKMKAARASTEPKVRKRIISFKNGMQELPARIATALGESVQTSVSIHSIRREADGWTVVWHNVNGEKVKSSFDRLIVTTPAHRLSSLPVDEALHEDLYQLNAISYPPVSVISMGFKREAIKHAMDGFGALVPECEERKILGALFPSSLFAGRAPEGEVLLTVFVGGERQPGCAQADTEALKEMVLPELDALFGVSGMPTFVHHRHWPKAIPQYKLGYGKFLDLMAEIELKHPGLQLAGNYRTGISVTYCIESALKVSA